MDCLSDALNNLRFQGTVYCLAEFSAPWGLRLEPREGHVSFFLPVRGTCIVTFDEMPKPFILAGGELILSPRGSGCTLQDSVATPVIPIQEAVGLPPPRGATLRYGGSGSSTSMVMGCFTLEAYGKNPLLSSLPGAIYLDNSQLQSEPWLEATTRLLSAEASSSRPGSDILVGRLADILFIQTIRAFMSQLKGCPESGGWLKALSDPNIGAALCLIHERPEAPWTVQSLAEAVGMSRTSFATKFTALVSETPIDYLTSWRMQKALRLMSNGQDNMAMLAAAVGYSSEAAFSKAFKRELGESPGGVRRKLAAVPT